MRIVANNNGLQRRNREQDQKKFEEKMERREKIELHMENNMNAAFRLFL
jgi:hypothetical protein